MIGSICHYKTQNTDWLPLLQKAEKDAECNHLAPYVSSYQIPKTTKWLSMSQ